MNDLELRIRVQGTVKQWVNQFMQFNGVSASMMDDALTRTLAELREIEVIELINAQDLDKQIAEKEKLTQDTPIDGNEKSKE